MFVLVYIGVIALLCVSLGFISYPEWWHYLILSKGFTKLEHWAVGIEGILWVVQDLVLNAFVVIVVFLLAISLGFVTIHWQKLKSAILYAKKLLWNYVALTCVVVGSCLVVGYGLFHVLNVSGDESGFGYEKIIEDQNDNISKYWRENGESRLRRLPIPSEDSTFIFIDDEVERLEAQFLGVREKVVSQIGVEEDSATVGAKVGVGLDVSKKTQVKTSKVSIENNHLLLKTVIEGIRNSTKWFYLTEDTFVGGDALELVRFKKTAAANNIQINSYAVDKIILEKSKESMLSQEKRILSQDVKFVFFSHKVTIYRNGIGYRLSSTPVSFGAYRIGLNSVIPRENVKGSFFENGGEYDINFMGLVTSKRKTASGIGIELYPLAIWI